MALTEGKRAVLRTAVAASAGAVAVTCALAGCGSVQLGAAAIIGGQRISAATLASDVTDVQNALHASHGKVALQFPASELPQQVLGWIVRFQVRERLATADHISVTPADGQRALAAIEAQSRQSGSAVPLP